MTDMEETMRSNYWTLHKYTEIVEEEVRLLRERVEKLEERAKIATSAEVFQAIHEGGLERKPN